MSDAIIENMNNLDPLLNLVENDKKHVHAIKDYKLPKGKIGDEEKLAARFQEIYSELAPFYGFKKPEPFYRLNPISRKLLIESFKELSKIYVFKTKEKVD